MITDQQFTLNCQVIRHTKLANFHVQLGKGTSKYRDKLITRNISQAVAYYNGYNVHSGYKKRLLMKDHNLTITLDKVLTQ